MILALSLLLVFVKSQKITNNYQIKKNEFGWFTWDATDKFIFFTSNDDTFYCKFDQQCQQFDTKDLVPSLIKLSAINSYFLDYKNNRLVKFNYLDNDFTVSVIPQDITNFAAISLTDSYLYLYQESYDSQLLIISSSQSILKLPSLTTRWEVFEDGLYAFQQNEVNTFLLKTHSDGTMVLWNTTLSLCHGATRFFISSCGFFAHVICPPNNVVIQLDNVQGMIIKIFSINWGNIVEISCSLSSLFILYDDARVEQYTSNSDYVYSYIVNNTKIIPKYNQIISKGEYLIYGLCKRYIVPDQCPEIDIVQWSVKNSPQYTLISETLLPELNIGVPNFQVTINKGGVHELFNSIKIDPVSVKNNILHENSNFDAISYIDGESIIIAFFSGSGNVQRATVGNRIITKLTIPKQDLSSITVSHVFVFSDEIYPLSRYASHFFLTSKSEYIIIIHGGLHADLETVNSMVFALQVSTGNFEKLSQSHPLP
jgi:hypothetical protein